MPARTAVKRSAPSSKAHGPPTKKVAVSKSKTVGRNKGNPDHDGKKRRLPITVPADAHDDPESEDEGNEGDFAADEGADLDDGENNPEMKTNLLAKNPNASRESHKAQREVTRQRQAAKPHADVLSLAKRQWSLARQRNISHAERQKHVKVLMDAVRGKIQDVVFKHDASRVVQTIIKCGTSQEREEVAVELKGRYRDLAQNKYAKFLVTKLLRYCPSQRASIISEFQHHVMRLLLHREASPVVADAYELYSNAAQRDLLLRDFYGKEVALFDTPNTALTDGDKKRGLQIALHGADTERKKRILGALKDNLINIFNNPDKGAVSHGIVHRALWEYLQVINETSDVAEQDKKRHEIFESCQELVAEMVHTKDGSRAVREFLAQGTAKDRKQIIKVLKPHLERMCKDEEAQLVLFTTLDVVDDTKLISKSVVSEITLQASTFAFDSHKSGRRTLLYLLVPRSPRHFTPATVNILAETDGSRARTSKKDPELRIRELRTAASEPLLNLVVHNAEELCRDPGASLLVVEIMLFTEGDKTAAMKALLAPLSKPYPTPVPSNGELMHLIDISHSSRLFKTLIQGGHFDRSTSSVQVVSSFSPSSFASQFMQVVGRENMIRMALGNGAFVVAELVKRISEEGAETEKSELKGWFDQNVVSNIRVGQGRGSEALLRTLGCIQ